MIRVLVGMIFHETNTFSPFKTGIPEFKSVATLSVKRGLLPMRTQKRLWVRFLKHCKRRRTLKLYRQSELQRSLPER